MIRAWLEQGWGVRAGAGLEQRIDRGVLEQSLEHVLELGLDQVTEKGVGAGVRSEVRAYVGAGLEQD